MFNKSTFIVVTTLVLLGAAIYVASPSFLEVKHDAKVKKDEGVSNNSSSASAKKIEALQSSSQAVTRELKEIVAAKSQTATTKLRMEKLKSRYTEFFMNLGLSDSDAKIAYKLMYDLDVYLSETSDLRYSNPREFKAVDLQRNQKTTELRQAVTAFLGDDNYKKTRAWSVKTAALTVDPSLE